MARHMSVIDTNPDIELSVSAETVCFIIVKAAEDNSSHTRSNPPDCLSDSRAANALVGSISRGRHQQRAVVEIKTQMITALLFMSYT